MCCEFILRHFIKNSSYELVEDTFDQDDIEQAIKILNYNEPGLVIHFNINGNVTFSRRFIDWYSRIPEPLLTFMNEFNIVRATCDVNQLFFMGKLDREKHYIFLKLIRDHYLD